VLKSISYDLPVSNYLLSYLLHHDCHGGKPEITTPEYTNLPRMMVKIFLPASPQLMSA